ncbi:unnamed protein product [Dibothriocephalus latus]|uniref:Uncharacterized protein n=1 Tax=Dibothriocephalus latus TaxID=60516 RepID=A0A3P6QAX2_DIBLA|nr:unnamed protein product [Dibothriocephalus latus]
MIQFAPNEILARALGIMSQFTIPEEILWNPIITARISRYLSKKDRLNCRSLIPTWDRLIPRILALSPSSLTRQAELLAILQDAPKGLSIFLRDFATKRGKDVIQLLISLSGPAGTGLVNVTTLDILKQPISIEQMSDLIANCPMPQLRVLSLSVTASTTRTTVTESLKSNLNLEEVDIQILGELLPSEVLLLIHSFGEVRNISLDDSSLRRYMISPPPPRRAEETHPAWTSWRTSLRIHHQSELLDLFLGEKKYVMQIPELTLLGQPGYFFPSRYISNFPILPSNVKYGTLKNPPLYIRQVCRACARPVDRRRLPRLQCPSADLVPDGVATVNFVACSLMSVEDNCILHPLNLHDLYIHLNPYGKISRLTSLDAESSSIVAITEDGRQALMKSVVENLIQRHCSEIRKLSIRLCEAKSDEILTQYVRRLIFITRYFIFPIIEMCSSQICSLEVSAEIIWACCTDVQTRSRLLLLKDKCLNIRKATVVAIEGPACGQKLRASAAHISMYLSLFPALKEVRIMAVEIIRDMTIHRLLDGCKNLQRLYIFCHQLRQMVYLPLPRHDALELLFLELNGLSGADCCDRLLNGTLALLLSLRYILLKVEHSKYPRVKTLKDFFAHRTKLQWLVVVFSKYGKVLLCHADEDSTASPNIIRDPTFHLGNLTHTYPELYDIFWKEFPNCLKATPRNPSVPVRNQSPPDPTWADFLRHVISILDNEDVIDP